MLCTAIFRTFAAKNADSIGAEDFCINVAWNIISLTGNLGNPKAVNDVVRDLAEINNGTLGNVERIGSDDVLVGVVKLPPPLVADYRYIQVAIAGDVL